MNGTMECDLCVGHLMLVVAVWLSLQRAKAADHSGSVATSWGEKLRYNPGEDYIVRHGPGDYGVVKNDIFAITYHIPEPERTITEEYFESGSFETFKKPAEVRLAHMLCAVCCDIVCCVLCAVMLRAAC